uniref:N-acetylgalactosaminide beta-1,3-galactosyltransferase n=1 Tax=Caenorhabditis tropicalis TaxID=1561998 RepID=A0A1I7T7Y0_9PELO
MWTMVPAILKFSNISDWTIIAEDISDINIGSFGNFVENRLLNTVVFSGFGLQDREYPLLSAGFILSRSVIETIRKVDRNERWSGFAIDAKYEFSLLIHKWNNVIMEHNPTVFCCGDIFDTCIVTCSLPAPPVHAEPLLDSEIHVMIKTFDGHHQNRLSVLKNTWTSDISRIEYCSNKEDLSIPTVDLGVGNTERGHCVKTWAIFKRFLNHSGKGAKWLVVADDDTLMSWKRLKQMLEMYDPEEKIIIGERYGFGFGMDGESGYDYPTGGSGMIFSQTAIESLLKTCPSCAADNDPDDMTIGICAVTSGIPIIHEHRLHQARPNDYSPEYLQEPISFHKFTDIDPIFVYYKYLVDFDNHPDTFKTEL